MNSRCGYCLRDEEDVRRIWVRCRIGGWWQYSMLVGRECRGHLRGLWKYAKKGETRP